MAQLNQHVRQQQGAQGNPICIRLEGQLATIDRGAGTGDPAKDEQIRRYQEAQAKQQAELDRRHAAGQADGLRKLGLLLAVQRPARRSARPVNNQIQQMRANLDQITTSLERLRSGGIGGADRENQRRSVLTALAQNNCRPAICRRRARSRQLHRQSVRQQQQFAAAAERRSRCAVRHLPHRLRPHLRRRVISRCRSPPCQARFQDDERTCKALCPATEATLFAYRNPGEDINQAVSISGQPISVAAERVQIPHRVQPVLRLQGRGPDLVGSAEVGRRQGRASNSKATSSSPRRARGGCSSARSQRRATPRHGQEGRNARRSHRRRAAARRTGCRRLNVNRHDRRKGQQVRTVGPTFIPPKQ